MRHLRRNLFTSLVLFSTTLSFAYGKSCVEVSSFKQNSSLLTKLKTNTKHFLNGNCLVKKINSPIEKTNFTIVPYLLERQARANIEINDCYQLTSLTFDKQDQEDHQWRPQGVSFQNGYGFVSWYHRKTIDGKLTNQNGELGMRLSIIDLKTGLYNHFLLIDKDEKRIIGHADGLVVKDNLAFVADYNYGIHIFDLNNVNSYNRSIKRLGSIKTDSCRFPIYQMANLSLYNEKISFTPYQQQPDKLNLFQFELEDIFNKERFGAKMVNQQLPFQKVQGFSEYKHKDQNKYLFLSQKGELNSQLILTDMKNGSKVFKYNLPAGIEDAEVKDKEVVTVTEFDKRKAFLVIKIKE